MPTLVVELVSAPLVPEQWLSRLADPAAGAVTSFAGLVRNHHEGRGVTHMEYSAHEEMARAQMERIAREMCERWPLAGALLVHRLGRLEIGEVSVLVAASAAHRAETFEACRHGIETLKGQVPIWKKEYYQEGGARWIGETVGS